MGDSSTEPDATHPPDELSGRILGDFELVRRLGIGGMGQVYLARQRSLKRQVAIKILRSELAADTTALRRFQAEAEAVANITHAHIVQVYAIGSADGLHYMALEYVDGRTLRDLLEKRGIPDVPVALEILRQVAAALDRAGELGFVHRDIKPENILLSKKGEVKVTDFGLSRCFATEAPLHLTQSGVTMGTPLYMSPEQVRGQPVDPRSDIYSFGVTAYHMLAGEPPFQAATAFDVALQHVQAEPRPLNSLRPDLPADLCAVVHRMMQKRPADRYQSAREVLNDLVRLQAGAAPIGASAFFPGLGSTSTGVMPIVSIKRNRRRYALVAGLAILAAGAGMALHWATTPRAVLGNPDDALADVDPAPSALKERELRKQLTDRNLKTDIAQERILELAELLVDAGRSDEALRLFDADVARRFEALQLSGKETVQHRNMLVVLTGLGRGIVLAHQDKAEESNKEFLRIVALYPANKDKLPKKGPLAGPLEDFFFRAPAGAAWKRAVLEALDRNAKNLNGKSPSELGRLRMVPAKGPRV